MKLGIVHFHMNRGGVTQVILNQLRALDEPRDRAPPEFVLLLHAGRRDGLPADLTRTCQHFTIAEAVVPELEYDESMARAPQPGRLVNRLLEALNTAGCARDETVLHVHNHALGKNCSLPIALCDLARRGYRLLLQVHDFVEDFRPANYRRLQQALSQGTPEQHPSKLYPQASHVHYAVLNRRDFAVLADAGVEPSRLHLLPNPVLPLSGDCDRAVARRRIAGVFGLPRNGRFVLSPVRAIRRKNLGESLLWAAVAPALTSFGFTLPPLNPLEQPRYLHWQSLASELKLPCHFNLSAKGLTLVDNLTACDLVLTTSVAEGFGFVFLEPSLAGRAVVGRDLPEITRDFVAEGIMFPGLHHRVSIPFDWINMGVLLDAFEQRYNSVMQAYGLPLLSHSVLRTTIENDVHDGTFDFGSLTPELQESVIRRVCGDLHAKSSLLDRNPWMSDLDTSDAGSGDARTVENNARIVRERYSLSSCGDRLASVYQCVTDSPFSTECRCLPNSGRILTTFVQPNRFHPVRL